jgi:hypothetical protein
MFNKLNLWSVTFSFVKLIMTLTRDVHGVVAPPVRAVVAPGEPLHLVPVAAEGQARALQVGHVPVIEQNKFIMTGLRYYRYRAR